MAVPVPEMPPYRPPSEAASILIRVTRGCAWNRCAFCGMYKNERFSIRSLAEIERDLAAIPGAHAGAAGRSVFLGDSDCLVHPDLPEIVRAVRRALPDAARITAYTRLHTLWRRPAAFLARLREAGLTRVHAGLESGDAEVLRLTCKGIDPERAVDAARKALAAGFELSLYLLSGLGGEERWESHAHESARVVAAAAPHFLRLRSLVTLPGTALEEARMSGTFRPITPLTRLRETRLLVAELAELFTASRLSDKSNESDESDESPAASQADSAVAEMELCSDHFSNYIWGDGELIYGGVNGYLPGDRDLLLAALDDALAAAGASRKLVDPASLAAGGRAPGMYGLPSL